MPDCTAVPQPILPCEAGAGSTYISGACPHVGHVLNGSLVKQFTGSPTNYITVPTGVDLIATGDITISMWIKPSDALASARTAIFSHYAHEDSTPNHAGSVVWQHDNKIGFGCRRTVGGTNYFAVQTVSTVVAPEEWHHIAAVYSGVPGTNAIYVDGVDQTLGPPNGWPTAPSTLPGGMDDPAVPAWIGAGRAFTDTLTYFKGGISNVAYCVGTGRSPAEVLAEYQVGCPADLTESTLHGYWPLDGNLTDISAGGNSIGNGTEVGSVPDEIDVTRPVTQIKQEDLDISAISATTALYYTIWQDPVHSSSAAYNYGARLGEITLHYTAAGGGGGGAANVITAPDTLVSNTSFSTVSGNAVIIDSRDKIGVRILGMNSAYDCALRKDTSGGDIISYVPAGGTRLRASIPVADGTDVYLDGDSNTTLTFSWSPKAR